MIIMIHILRWQWKPTRLRQRRRRICKRASKQLSQSFPLRLESWSSQCWRYWSTPRGRTWWHLYLGSTAGEYLLEIKVWKYEWQNGEKWLKELDKNQKGHIFKKWLILSKKKLPLEKKTKEQITKAGNSQSGDSIIKIFWPIRLNDLWSKMICKPKMIVRSAATFILRWSC